MVTVQQIDRLQGLLGYAIAELTPLPGNLAQPLQGTALQTVWLSALEELASVSGGGQSPSGSEPAFAALAGLMEAFPTPAVAEGEAQAAGPEVAAGERPSEAPSAARQEAAEPPEDRVADSGPLFANGEVHIEPLVADERATPLGLEDSDLFGGEATAIRIDLGHLESGGLLTDLFGPAAGPGGIAVSDLEDVTLGTGSLSQVNQIPGVPGGGLIDLAGGSFNVRMTPTVVSAFADDHGSLTVAGDGDDIIFIYPDWSLVSIGDGGNVLTYVSALGDYAITAINTEVALFVA